jgi:hypothetical protein
MPQPQWPPMLAPSPIRNSLGFLPSGLALSALSALALSSWPQIVPQYGIMVHHVPYYPLDQIQRVGNLRVPHHNSVMHFIFALWLDLNSKI